MSLVETYRRNVERKTDELTRLLAQKANESSKLSGITNKINSTSQAISRTTSTSIKIYKYKEIERYQKEYATIEKKVADLDKNIGRKQKEVGDEQKKVFREEQSFQKKQVAEQLKQSRKHQQHMEEVSSTLYRHETLHMNTLSKIDELKKLPDHITVLYLASNPLDQIALRLDEEARAIQDMIRKSKHRDAVNLQTRWAVRPLDVLQAINELEPTIVHFSSHGSKDSEIIFQRDDGSTQAVPKEAIVAMIAASSQRIKLVFFNSCYSQQQALEITQHIDAAIGMKTSISDDSARIFAAQFYSAVGFGLSIRKAFDQGKAAILLEGTNEEKIPELYVRGSINPDNLVLVSSRETGNHSDF